MHDDCRDGHHAPALLTILAHDPRIQTAACQVMDAAVRVLAGRIVRVGSSPRGIRALTLPPSASMREQPQKRSAAALKNTTRPCASTTTTASIACSSVSYQDAWSRFVSCQFDPCVHRCHIYPCNHRFSSRKACGTPKDPSLPEGTHHPGNSWLRLTKRNGIKNMEIRIVVKWRPDENIGVRPPAQSFAHGASSAPLKRINTIRTNLFQA